MKRKVSVPVLKGLLEGGLSQKEAADVSGVHKDNK